MKFYSPFYYNKEQFERKKPIQEYNNNQISTNT